MQGLHGIDIPRHVQLSKIDELLTYAEKGERELLEAAAEWYRRESKRRSKARRHDGELDQHGDA